MPRAAIAANVVDYVLAPPQIAAELAAHRPPPLRRSRGVAVALPPELEDGQGALPAGLRRCCARPSASISPTTSSTPSAAASRGAWRCATVDDLAGYVALLRRGPRRARGALPGHPHHGDRVLPRARDLRGAAQRGLSGPLEGRAADQELRLWVPGCASGEEAYSLAMALDDFLAGQARQAAGQDLCDRRQPARHRPRAARHLRRGRRCSLCRPTIWGATLPRSRAATR